MTKIERVNWTAPRLACRLLVRSVVNSVQAYWRFATASMAMMQAASWRHRVAPGSEFCGSVMSNSSDNVGQDGILSHGFSSVQGVITRHEGSSDNVGQDAILSHAFSSFQGVITRHEGSSDNVGQDAILSHAFSSFQGVITRHEGSSDNVGQDAIL